MVNPTSVVNLTVHGVGPAPRQLDPDEDGTWVSVDRFERVLDAVTGRDDVVITFDDGNASDVDIALPRLLDRKLTAEFFLPAGLLGQPGRLDYAGVRQLLRAGMSIGSHGWAHVNWRGLDPQRARQEMVEAHRVLDELTGQRVTRVAVPFGSYDRHVLRRLRQAHVTRVYTSDGGRARPGSWLQSRNSLRHDLDAEWIDGVLNSVPPLPVRMKKLAARTVKRMRG